MEDSRFALDNDIKSIARHTLNIFYLILDTKALDSCTFLLIKNDVN